MTSAVESLGGPQSPTPTHTHASRRWVGVFLLAWLVSAAICARLALLPGYPGDVSHYKYWTRVITLDGIESIYGGTYPESYAIYPPVTLYAYGLVGELYQRFAEYPWGTERMLASEGFSTGIKGVAVAFHLLLGAVLFGIARALYGDRSAALVSAAYLLNPAVLFDVAYWGQPNAAHSTFAVLALGWMLIGTWPLSWVAAGLAAMTKPQAWALVPLFMIAQLRRFGLQKVLLGCGIGAVVSLIVLFPWLKTGRLQEFLSLPSHIAGVMPVASANAHNLWWIVTGNPLPVVLDSERVLGPITYRLAALPLVLAVAAFALWRLWASPSTSVFMLAAYQAFGWFCFTTQAHEDHPFMIVPLLLMAAPVAPAARVLAGVVSLTLLANMALHDPVLVERFAHVVSDSTRHRWQLANSGVNLLVFAAWTLLLILMPRWCGDAKRHVPKAVAANVL